MDYQCEWVVNENVLPCVDIFRDVDVFVYKNKDGAAPLESIPIFGLDSLGNWYYLSEHIDGTFRKLNPATYASGWGDFALCSIPLEHITDIAIARFTQDGHTTYISEFEQYAHGCPLRVVPPVRSRSRIYREDGEVLYSTPVITAACAIPLYAVIDQ